MQTRTATAAPAIDSAPALSFDEVYAAHVTFVWRVLRALGVAPGQLEDAAQDVFVVVHRRLGDFEGRSSITTWLFGIMRRVAARYRHRATAQSRTEPLRDFASDTSDPFADAARAEAAATVTACLDRMDDDKRVVFALVELEQIPVAEVARMLELNLNTAYSRLRLARAEFSAALRRRS